MKEIYPVFIAENNNEYLVYVPDWEIYTEGKRYGGCYLYGEGCYRFKGD